MSGTSDKGSIKVQSGKRAYVELVDGTINTMTDGSQYVLTDDSNGFLSDNYITIAGGCTTIITTDVLISEVLSKQLLILVLVTTSGTIGTASGSGGGFGGR